MKLRFKTLFINTLATLLVTHAAFANTANQNVELNLQQEVEQNLQLLLADIKAPSINTSVIKQLNHGYLLTQTNKLLQSASQSLPTYKFKVVIAD
ncbi:MAG: hypothetical protein ACI965_001697 [Paraglaciecola sp.]|jgi:hypothetical protein